MFQLTLWTKSYSIDHGRGATARVKNPEEEGVKVGEEKESGGEGVLLSANTVPVLPLSAVRSHASVL